MTKEAPVGSPSDNELIARFKKGDSRAFTDLYERYSAPIFRFALDRVTDPEVALDVVQDVFLKIFVAKFDLERGASFKTWVFTIARNTLIDTYRKHSRESRMVVHEADSEENNPYDPADNNPGTEEIIERREAVETIKQASGKRFPLLWLFYVSGLTGHQLEGLLGVKRATINTHLRRIKEELRDNPQIRGLKAV